MHRSRGITLVDLMVALALGLLLIGAAISVFIASKRSYTETERFARVSENGRFALQALEHDLRLAGFFGEALVGDIVRDADLGAVTGDCTNPAQAYDLANYIAVARADSTGAAFGCVTDAVPGTDVLVIKSVRPFPLPDGVRDEPTDDDQVIDAGFETGKAYVVANTATGVLIDGADGIATDIFPGGGNAWEYRFQVYYIRNAGTPQLSRKVLDGSTGAMTVVTEDIVDGIENLRVLVGQDGNNDGEVDQFVESTDPIDWARAPSMQVYLLTRSPDREIGYTDTRSYDMGAVSLTPGGNFRRIVMQGSVSLRNSIVYIRGNS